MVAERERRRIWSRHDVSDPDDGLDQRRLAELAWLTGRLRAGDHFTTGWGVQVVDSGPGWPVPHRMGLARTRTDVVGQPVARRGAEICARAATPDPRLQKRACPR